MELTSIWQQFGIRIVLAIIGLAIYSLFQVRDKLKVFNLNKFLGENKVFWIWAMSLQFIFAILLLIEPTAGGAITIMTGLDYDMPMAFVTSGMVLGAAANGISNDKIGNKPML